MHCLLIYDIPDDATRNKVADFCLDYGLDRIQYSAFLGELSFNHMQELMKKIRSKISTQPAKVLLVPLPADAWEKRLIHETKSQSRP
ncbi:MAG: CRISPR-associated endonuclease Cas2 [Anaerolinea sp.]|nr:CRISPR-associated endonuclease Cas2 [Anaerolinea sp.]